MMPLYKLNVMLLMRLHKCILIYMDFVGQAFKRALTFSLYFQAHINK